MKTYYSILKFVNNSLSEENIAIGFVMVCDSDIYFKISDRKIDFVKKLNPKCSKLVEFYIKNLKIFVDIEISSNKEYMFKFDSFNNIFDLKFINRLHNYNNNIIQFSKPMCLDSYVNQNLFAKYFNKFIDDIYDSKVFENANKYSALKENVKNKLYNPLRDKIDVDFTLKKKQLPSLFFDFHFDAIGVNGAMYAAKSVDLNSKRKISDIKSDISEYESVIERLNKFADKRNINGNHQYYLISDPYEGHVISYIDLYSVLEEGNMPFFKLTSSADLGKLSDKIIENKAHKFSEELVEV